MKQPQKTSAETARTKLVLTKIIVKSAASLLFLLFFSFSNKCFSQGSGNFAIDPGIVLKLDKSNLEYDYQIQISDELKKVDLKSYFNVFNTEISTIAYSTDKTYFVVSIEKRARPNWSINDWNNYLNSLHVKAINYLKK